MDDYSFDTWGRDDLGYAEVFPTASAIPNTSDAKPTDWLGVADRLGNIYNKFTGRNAPKEGQPQPAPKPAEAGKTEVPSWVWVAGAVAAGLLLIYVIKD